MVEPFTPKPFGALDREPLAKGPVPAQMRRESPINADGSRTEDQSLPMKPIPGVAAAMSATDSRVQLDPSDPFEAALIPIVETNRRKRADYALDGDPFSNFRGTAEFIGRPTWVSPLFNCAQKLERVKSLMANGRLDDPRNEAVEDTILDNAVYGVIAWAIYRHDRPNP
jgi:hypothetical protein